MCQELIYRGAEGQKDVCMLFKNLHLPIGLNLDCQYVITGLQADRRLAKLAQETEGQLEGDLERFKMA